jgi:hypothetical protein
MRSNNHKGFSGAKGEGIPQLGDNRGVNLVECWSSLCAASSLKHPTSSIYSCAAAGTPSSASSRGELSQPQEPMHLDVTQRLQGRIRVGSDLRYYIFMLIFQLTRYLFPPFALGRYIIRDSARAYTEIFLKTSRKLQTIRCILSQ